MTTLAPPAAVRIGPEGLPAPTLGWQILQWTADYLLQPDGPNAGTPWMYTPEQVRFVLWWYAVDRQGQFVYRRGMLRRMKGWGKDPLGASLCCVEFVGPCRFGGWKNGEPIAIPHSAPWVQTAAVSKDQTRNTMTLFPGMLSKRAQEEFNIDLGKEIIYAHKGKARIEAVTSSPRALEGGRATFILKNETHHWLTSNEGLEMSAVIARNAAKSRDGSSRVLAISNAHNPGEESDAEHDWDAYQKIASGQSKATGFLYDSLEAPADTELADRDSLKAGIIAARGDSTWLDVDRLIEEIYDPSTPPSTSRRFYLNQIIATEDAWVTPQEWDNCKDDHRPFGEREQISLGFDGSKSDDHTALVGETIEDGHQFVISLWTPDQYVSGEIPMKEVDERVAWVFEHYDVVAFYGDVHPFETYIDKWEQEYGDDLCARSKTYRPIGYDMRGSQREVTAMVEAYHDAIVERAVTHPGDPAFSQYIYNARRRPNQYGVTFGKETMFSSRKIDAAAAGALAHKARADYLALPENKKRKYDKVEFFWMND